jgi:hypothetical protein
MFESDSGAGGKKNKVFVLVNTILATRAIPHCGMSPVAHRVCGKFLYQLDRETPYNDLGPGAYRGAAR